MARKRKPISPLQGEQLSLIAVGEPKNEPKNEPTRPHVEVGMLVQQVGDRGGLWMVAEKIADQALLWNGMGAAVVPLATLEPAPVDGAMIAQGWARIWMQRMGRTVDPGALLVLAMEHQANAALPPEAPSPVVRLLQVQDGHRSYRALLVCDRADWDRAGELCDRAIEELRSRGVDLQQFAAALAMRCVLQYGEEVTDDA